MSLTCPSDLGHGCCCCFPLHPTLPPSPGSGWELYYCQNHLARATVMERTPGHEQSCWGFGASRHVGAQPTAESLRTSEQLLLFFFSLSKYYLVWRTDLQKFGTETHIRQYLSSLFILHGGGGGANIKAFWSRSHRLE